MKMTRTVAKRINEAHLTGENWYLSSLAWTVRIIATRVRGRKRQFQTIAGDWITFDAQDMHVHG